MTLPSESKTPSLIECLRKLVEVFEEENIDYMFIGGLALPAYGEIRATQDVDVAVLVTNLQTLEHLFNELAKRSFELTAEPMLEAACIYVLDRKNMVDVKIWLKPDGIKFDKELLKRRQRREIPDMEVWVIGPEDFIVNKLSRADRRARDESDVVSVLIGQRGKLDREYLEKRAKEFDVFSLLQALEDKVKRIAK